MSKGFTLLEILVVIAIFTVLIALGLFMSMETLRGALSRSERDTVVSLLERARSRAMANIGQSPWGMCYLAPNYVVFKGTACSAATAVDTVAANPGTATTGLLPPGIVFSQLAGTTTPASVTVTQSGRTSAITINYEGAIIW
jgi:prepilin-type N-terminal cleavage/methylation domain-containing protein